MDAKSLLILILAGLGCSATAQALTAAQMRADLAYLREVWMPQDKSFSDGERATFHAIVTNAIAKADSMTPLDFELEVSRAVAASRNGHTEVSGLRLQRLPVAMWWFSDGLYIIKTHPHFSQLLGARVEKIGALTPEQAVARVTPYISGIDRWILWNSTYLLSSPEVLHKIGASSTATKVDFAVKMKNGKSSVVPLSVTPAADPGTGPLWQTLVPDRADLPGRWTHLLDSHGSLSPIYRSRVDVDHEWLGKDGKVLYIRSNQMVSATPGKSLHHKLQGLLDQVVAPRRPRYVIVDLRLNTGGNLGNTVLFAQALPKLIAPGGKIFVLVGPVTFSAAIVTVSMLRGHGGDDVMLLGEPMGDDAKFWAEGRPVALPHSGLRVRPAQGYHDWSKGCPDLDRCYWPNVVFATPNVDLNPDRVIKLSFADYSEGRDAVLEAALEMAKWTSGSQWQRECFGTFHCISST
jgi:hypothetical protein